MRDNRSRNSGCVYGPIMKGPKCGTSHKLFSKLVLTSGEQPWNWLHFIPSICFDPAFVCQNDYRGNLESAAIHHFPNSIIFRVLHLQYLSWGFPRAFLAPMCFLKYTYFGHFKLFAPEIGDRKLVAVIIREVLHHHHISREHHI